jgi:hypothetical protein
MYFPKDRFGDQQLSVLQTAFELTCTELGIDKDDSETRKKIAAALMAMANAGQFDLDRLRVYAESQAVRR